MSKTEKALKWMTVEVVRRYRTEHGCSLLEAKRKILDLTLTEAIKHAHGWEDLKLILAFQHHHKGYLL